MSYYVMLLIAYNVFSTGYVIGKVDHDGLKAHVGIFIVLLPIYGRILGWW